MGRFQAACMKGADTDSQGLCRSAMDTQTRAVYLDRVTRVDAASDFFGEPHVPKKAITMGVATILEVTEQATSLC